MNQKIIVNGFNPILLERAANEVKELIRLGFGNFPADGEIQQIDGDDVIVFSNGSHAPAIWFNYSPK